jgi:hypothetical protein
MAVGGYIAAKLTLLYSASVRRRSSRLLHHGASGRRGVAALSVLPSACLSAVAGRLPGDRTLGFGEIIRVIFQTSDFLALRPAWSAFHG